MHRAKKICIPGRIFAHRSQDLPYDISYYFLASLISRSGDTEKAYELIIEGLNSGNFEPSKDDFETQLYLTAAKVCAFRDDPLNHVRFLIRAVLNTDAPLTQIEELTAALKKCGPREKLLARLAAERRPVGRTRKR